VKEKWKEAGGEVVTKWNDELDEIVEIVLSGLSPLLQNPDPVEEDKYVTETKALFSFFLCCGWWRK